MHRVIAAIASFTLIAISPAAGQCQLLVRESFAPGPRPHGGNGRLRDANIHDNLSGYWPQVPEYTEWRTPNESGVVNWAFAGSSLDPLEIDPNDPYNGTAFGESGAVALLPFSAPPDSFTLSAETVMPFGLTGAIYLGYTSSDAFADNFETGGSLWVSLNGRGEWAVHAGGPDPVASGTAVFGTLAGGWLRVELTFDPAASTVSGRIGETPVGPVTVPPLPPIAYFGMEAREYWAVLNNLSIVRGQRLSAEVAGAPPSICDGQTVVLTAQTNAANPAAYFWERDGRQIPDGPLPGGAIVSGAQTNTLTITDFNALSAGAFDAVVANSCGLTRSPAVILSTNCGQTCDPDVNCDGSINGFDVEATEQAVNGDFSNFCQPDADYNRDGSINGFDIEAVEQAVNGAPCP
ncbi:hypothetical protein PHYC_03368 [Phycisphaerales bacterium]|nr:hypothetical protein PHYC_03368 [Phycisphaerales bacterium]